MSRESEGEEEARETTHHLFFLSFFFFFFLLLLQTIFLVPEGLPPPLEGVNSAIICVSPVRNNPPFL